MLEILIGTASIVVTVISVIATIISIRQNTGKKDNQKSNRTRQS